MWITSISGVYPWRDGRPDQRANCVRMDDNYDYKWADFFCANHVSTYQWGLCNLFSELCDQSEWSIIAGNGWMWTIQPCQVVTVNASADNMAIIAGKKWFNWDKPFVVEYRYTINNANSASSNGGIVIHFDTTCANYYYIGISPSDSTVFLAETFNNNILVIYSTPLEFTYNLGLLHAQD